LPRIRALADIKKGDAHRAAAKAKDVLPYSGVGAESRGKEIGKETGAKLDQAVSFVHAPTDMRHTDD
jgi:hypothetical protein